MSSNVYDLLKNVGKPEKPQEYEEKMFHEIPDVPVVDRMKYIGEKCEGKRVLDIGCTGKLGLLIREKAVEYYGVDINPPEGPEYYKIDIEKEGAIPYPATGVDLVVAGEIIEHLSNPGNFLDLLCDMKVPVILTTPNAFNAASQQYSSKGIEHVSKEHVSWFSWHTLKTLVQRHGFNIKEWFWYNGKPITAEGLIFYLEI